MLYLKDKTVYLVGNIHTTPTNDYGVEWREEITKTLQDRYQMIVIDPCKYEIGDTEQDQRYFKTLIKNREFIKLKKEFYKVVRKDLKCVDKADLVIFNHNPHMPTIGSIHEIVNAVNQKKPALIYCDEKYIEQLNPWLLTLIKPQWLFVNWNDMFKYLDNINNNELDSSHWW